MIVRLRFKVPDYFCTHKVVQTFNSLPFLGWGQQTLFCTDAGSNWHGGHAKGWRVRMTCTNEVQRYYTYLHQPSTDIRTFSWNLQMKTVNVYAAWDWRRIIGKKVPIRMLMDPTGRFKGFK